MLQKARMFEDARHFKLANGCSTVDRRGRIASGLWPTVALVVALLRGGDG
jgi:hypothetical protein